MTMKQTKKVAKKIHRNTAADTGLIAIDQLKSEDMRQFFLDHAAQVKPKMDQITPGLRPSPWDKKAK